ncbi:MAG: N-6 DNA methylase [Planctomycetota bacterium]
MYEISLADDGIQHARGSYYTPMPLVDHVLSTSLAPIVAEHEHDGADIGEITVCDPACGTGRFLVRAAEYFARRGIEIESVVRSQIFGVDLDPFAVDLCRLALWALCPGASPDVAESTVRTGNAVLGTVRNIDTAVGIPIDAYRARKGEDAALARTLRSRHRAEAHVVHPAGHSLSLSEADSWCVAFCWSEVSPDECITPSVLARIGPCHLMPPSISACVARHRFFHWEQQFAPVRTGGFDVVIGNPPFKSQLTTQTANAAGASRLMKHWSGGAVSGYADLASAFMCRGLNLVRTGGRVGFVLPRSLLASAHAKPVRAAVAAAAAVEAIWVSDGRAFTSASVETVALSVRRGAPQAAVMRTRGAAFEVCAPIEAGVVSIADGESWAPLAARPGALPDVVFNTGGVLAEIADATADFRDEYYGLRGAIVDDAAADGDRRLPLVTSGLIDLAQNRWGDRPARIHKQRWSAPCVEVERLDGCARMAQWVRQRSGPKVIVAVQTRVMEAWVDERGGVLPGLPLISVVPRDLSRIWQVAAVVASPVATLIAVRTAAGSAMSRDAIKLSARQVRSLPLPVDPVGWARGAELLRNAHQLESDDARRSALVGFAEAMVGAHGVMGGDAEALVKWWWARAFSSGRRAVDRT